MNTKRIQYRELMRYKYQLLADAWYYTGITGYEINDPYVCLEANGKLTCRRWYAWDGASGPARDTGSFMRASLFHDALYQCIRRGHLPGVYRKRADEIMREIAGADGMGRIRRWYTYWAVRLFGGGAAKEDRR